MRLQTTKIIRTAMHIQHNPFAVRIGLFSSAIVALHLNPFATQIPIGTAPLPPSLPTDSLDPSLAQLRVHIVSGFR